MSSGLTVKVMSDNSPTILKIKDQEIELYTLSKKSTKKSLVFRVVASKEIGITMPYKVEKLQTEVDKLNMLINRIKDLNIEIIKPILEDL